MSNVCSGVTLADLHNRGLEALAALAGVALVLVQADLASATSDVPSALVLLVAVAAAAVFLAVATSAVVSYVDASRSAGVAWTNPVFLAPLVAGAVGGLATAALARGPADVAWRVFVGTSGAFAAFAVVLALATVARSAREGYAAGRAD